MPGFLPSFVFLFLLARFRCRALCFALLFRRLSLPVACCRFLLLAWCSPRPPGATSIRDVIAFPLLRAEKGEGAPPKEGETP